MTLFEDTNPRELKELLGQIHGGETALPDFQRDFVWDPNATQELIVSIASSYPAGSLLRVRNTQKLFAARPFEGAPALGQRGPTYLVLDGQQRLTSLFQAFFGVGEHRFFLDIRALLSGSAIEECFFHHRANSKRARRYDFDQQAEQLVLPLAVLKGGSGEFGRWARKVARRLTGSARTELEDQLSDVEEQWIRAIDDYRFPVVTLSDQTTGAAVCTIFETLNRTGVKLSPFELLTARYWPLNVNLRQLWSEATSELPIIQDYDVDPYYMLQSVALIARPAPGCTRTDVLELESAAITDWWSKVARGLAKSLEILRDDCGVVTPRWLPYYPMLVPMAAILGKLDLKGKPAAGAARAKLARWFWCSVFGQAYEKASNSQSAKDFNELQAWIAGGAEPHTVRELQFDPRMLRDITPRQQGLYAGSICLVLRRGPLDFHEASKVTGDMILERRVDDHHVFPVAYLNARSGTTDRLRNCVLNRTLIDRSTNIRIGKRPPSKYLGETGVELGPRKLDAVLESHMLPTGAASPLSRDDFAAFLEWRQGAFWAAIQEVTGLRKASDLIEEGEAA